MASFLARSCALASFGLTSVPFVNNWACICQGDLGFHFLIYLAVSIVHLYIQVLQVLIESFKETVKLFGNQLMNWVVWFTFFLCFVDYFKCL